MKKLDNSLVIIALALLAMVLLLYCPNLFAQNLDGLTKWSYVPPTPVPVAPFQDPTYANWMAKSWLQRGHSPQQELSLMAIPPLPGWWRYGSQYLPCAYTPYTTWTDPVTQQQGWYARYDTAALIQSPQPDGTYGGQGGPNHTDQYYVDKMLQPFMPGDHPPPSWHYPCPVNPDVSALFLGYPFNAGQACPTSTYPTYSNKIAGNPVWLESWQVIKPQHDADCSGPQPTQTPAITATPTRTVVPPSPTITPTPGPNQFAHYIQWASQVGVTAGCGGGNYCPGNPVNRDSMAAFLFNLATWIQQHPGAVPVLPPCATPQAFNDVVCK